jgi:cytochrome b pre-mRNA-processing protein 3
MAAAFYGRIAAYEEGLAMDDTALAPALLRNLYGTAPPEAAPVRAMADYVRRAVARLDRQTAAELLAGRVAFGEPPTAAETREAAG